MKKVKKVLLFISVLLEVCNLCAGRKKTLAIERIPDKKEQKRKKLFPKRRKNIRLVDLQKIDLSANPIVQRPSIPIQAFKENTAQKPKLYSKKIINKVKKQSNLFTGNRYSKMMQKEVDESFNWCKTDFLNRTTDPKLRSFAAGIFEVMEKDPYYLKVFQGRKEKKFEERKNVGASSCSYGIDLPLKGNITKTSLTPSDEIIATHETCHQFLFHNSNMKNLTLDETEFQAQTLTGRCLSERKKLKAATTFTIYNILPFIFNGDWNPYHFGAINFLVQNLGRTKSFEKILSNLRTHNTLTEKVLNKKHSNIVESRFKIIENWIPVNHAFQAKKQLEQMKDEARTI